VILFRHKRQILRRFSDFVTVPGLFALIMTCRNLEKDAILHQGGANVQKSLIPACSAQIIASLPLFEM